MIVLGLWMASAAVAGTSPAESVEASAHRILTTKEFPFCQPSESPMPPWDRDWCDTAAQATTCPDIKAMCDRKWEGSWIPWHHGGSDAKQKLEDGEWGGAADLASSSLKAAAMLGWVIIAIVIAAVLALIVKVILDRPKRGEKTAEPDAPNDLPAAALEIQDTGLGEAGLLLRRARAEADRDVGRALALLYAAVLRHLEDAGLIRWERSVTNRQYVRDVRGRTPLDAPMADLIREVERARFGRESPPRMIFDALYQRIAAGFPGAVLLAIVLTSGCSGCAYGDPGVDGHAAFNEILAAQGIRPTRVAVPIDKVTGDSPPLLVDALDLTLNGEMLAAIERAVLTGARVLLVMNAKERLTDWPYLAGHVGKGRAIQPDPGWAQEVGLDPPMKGALPSPSVIDLDDDERDPPDVLLEQDGEPIAVRWQSDAGELLILGDRDLLANASMAVPANARLALALARDVVGDRTELATAALGLAGGAETPNASLEEAGMWPLTLQILFALAILFWARGAAFGQLRDRTASARRTFSEHVSAVGLQLACGRGSRFAASLYATYALERLWARTGQRAGGRDSSGLAASVAARTGRPAEEVDALLKEADAARRDPDGRAAPERDLELIRRLRSLLEIIRA